MACCYATGHIPDDTTRVEDEIITTIDENGRALVRYKCKGASIKYHMDIYCEKDEIVPANERPGCSHDHWYCPTQAKNRKGFYVEGDLFTTRMPQGISNPKKAVQLPVTDPKEFQMNVVKSKVKYVFVLVEEFELESRGSKELFDFYEKECNLKVFHRPIKDLSVPSQEDAKKIIGEIVHLLADKHNVLLHCLGGSGRTGTVVVGVLKVLGCAQPIREARKVKSVYLDKEVQAEFIQDISGHLGLKFVQEHPKFALHNTAEFIKELSTMGLTGKVTYKLQPAPISDDDYAALKFCWEHLDPLGSKAFSLGEVKGNGPRSLSIAEFAIAFGGFLEGVGGAMRNARRPPHHHARHKGSGGRHPRQRMFHAHACDPFAETSTGGRYRQASQRQPPKKSPIDIKGLQILVNHIAPGRLAIYFGTFVTLMQMCKGEEVNLAGASKPVQGGA